MIGRIAALAIATIAPIAGLQHNLGPQDTVSQDRPVTAQHDAIPKPKDKTPSSATAPNGTLYSTANLSGVPASTPNVFDLNSRPGSTKTIYLNFRGGSVGGSGWTSKGGAWSKTTQYVEPFDLDGYPGTVNDLEKKYIYTVWQRVSADYETLDVNVTTKPPTLDQINRTDVYDRIYGTETMITPTNKVTYTSCSCAGQSYVGVFSHVQNHQFYQPSLVYTRSNLSDAARIAEATSHETGHALGLVHDGDSTSAYSRGNTLWAPIMGASYDKPVTTFTNGSGNNTQDDFATIQSHGVNLLADDAGSTTSTARWINIGRTNRVYVNSASDVDMFKIYWPGGTMTTEAKPLAYYGTNADLRMDLLNNSGTYIIGNNPAITKVSNAVVSGNGAKIVRTIPAGYYYLKVYNVGNSYFPAYGSRDKYIVYFK